MGRCDDVPIQVDAWNLVDHNFQTSGFDADNAAVDHGVAIVVDSSPGPIILDQLSSGVITEFAVQ